MYADLNLYESLDVGLHSENQTRICIQNAAILVRRNLCVSSEKNAYLTDQS